MRSRGVNVRVVLGGGKTVDEMVAWVTMLSSNIGKSRCLVHPSLRVRVAIGAPR